MVTAFLIRDDEYTNITATGETKREAAEYLETYLSELEGVDYRVGYYFNVYLRFMPNLSGGYSLSFAGSDLEAGW